MQIPSDIIIQLTNSGNWVVYNVFTRDGLGVTGKTLELLKNINQGKSKDEINQIFLIQILLYGILECFQTLMVYLQLLHKLSEKKRIGLTHYL